MLIIKEHKIY